MNKLVYIALFIFAAGVFALYKNPESPLNTAIFFMSNGLSVALSLYLWMKKRTAPKYKVFKDKVFTWCFTLFILLGVASFIMCYACRGHKAVDIVFVGFVASLCVLLARGEYMKRKKIHLNK